MAVTLVNITRGEDIEAESLRIIDAELPEPRPQQGAEWAVVRRLIHTTADFDMAALARFHPQAVSAGIAALRAGCLILTDTEMARAGMTPRRLNPFGVEVKCFQGDASVAARAQALLASPTPTVHPDYTLGQAWTDYRTRHLAGKPCLAGDDSRNAKVWNLACFAAWAAVKPCCSRA